MAVPYHTHTFDIPTASKEETAEATISDKAVVPSSLNGVFLKPDDIPSIVDQVEDLVNATLLTAPRLVQKKLMEPFFGFDAGGGGPNTEIYTGSGFTAQAPWVFDMADGTSKVFISQRCALPDGNYKTTERCRIVMFPLLEDGSIGAAEAYTQELNIGHGGSGLSGTGTDLTDLYLYAWSPTVSGHEDTDCGKGYSKIKWQGSATSQSDVESFRLLGYAGTTERRSEYYHADVTVDPDTDEVVLLAFKAVPGSDAYLEQTVMIFNKQEVEAAADDAARLLIDPIDMWIHELPQTDRGKYKQGLAYRFGILVTASGFANPFVGEAITIFDRHGDRKRRVYPSTIRREYGYENLMNHPTLGTPFQFEPEGVCIRSNKEIVLMMMDHWRSGADIVTYPNVYDALNPFKFSRIGPAGANDGPWETDYWARTEKAATAGAFNSGTTYSSGATATRRSKVLYSIRVPMGDDDEYGLSEGMLDYWPQEVPTSGWETTPTQRFRMGQAYYVSAHSSQFNADYPAFAYFYGLGSQSSLRVFDLYEQPGVSYGFQMFYRNSGGRHIGGTSLSNGVGSANWYALDDSTTPGEWILRTPSSGGMRLRTGTNGALVPWTAGAALGESGTRWGPSYIESLFIGSTSAIRSGLSGAGSPEGVVTAGVGSDYRNTSGGASTTLYIKTSGTGNTGWTAK